VVTQHDASFSVQIQDVSKHRPVPGARALRGWLTRAFGDELRGELSIRIVGEAESAALNERYRNRSGPTNVLSFAGTDVPDGAGEKLLGDLVICAPVLGREAQAQGKSLDAHWAHISVHGTLHLLGYDHVEKADAARMERREVDLLAMLGFDDPYADET
jgi:probable rRNA maturation factor